MSNIILIDACPLLTLLYSVACGFFWLFGRSLIVAIGFALSFLTLPSWWYGLQAIGQGGAGELR